MSEMARDATELKASLQFTQNEVDNIKKSLHEKYDVLDDVVKRIEVVASVLHEIENGIDYLENQTRRNNLRIGGVTEGNAETWADTEAAISNISEKQARDIRIERAHRMTENYRSEVLKIQRSGDLSTCSPQTDAARPVFQRRPVSTSVSQ